MEPAAKELLPQKKLEERSANRPMTAVSKERSEPAKERVKRLKSGENRLPAVVEAPTFAPKINKKSVAIVRDKKALTLIKPEQKQIVPEKTLPKVSDRYLL